MQKGLILSLEQKDLPPKKGNKTFYFIFFFKMHNNTNQETSIQETAKNVFHKKNVFQTKNQTDCSKYFFKWYHYSTFLIRNILF